MESSNYFISRNSRWIWIGDQVSEDDHKKTNSCHVIINFMFAELNYFAARNVRVTSRITSSAAINFRIALTDCQRWKRSAALFEHSLINVNWDVVDTPTLPFLRRSFAIALFFVRLHNRAVWRRPLNQPSYMYQATAATCCLLNWTLCWSRWRYFNQAILLCLLLKGEKKTSDYMIIKPLCLWF